MFPDKKEALRLLKEGNTLNPGPWYSHSLVTAQCAHTIASHCPEMDAEKAYILGMLHDIGRRFGVTYLRHVLDGYEFLMELGYEEPAKICLTHSFAEKDLSTYIGKQDVTEKERDKILIFLSSIDYDDYDRLIQVCDSIALPQGPVEMEIRMNDVKTRYGYYPESKWKKHLELKTYFEKKMNLSLKELFAVQSGI